MADFLKVMNKVFSAEHNSTSTYLHYNKKESNYTFMGIYPYTKLESHHKIEDAIKGTSSTKEASEVLALDEKLYQEVLGFYYLNFWKPMMLDEIESDHKASEIMVFIINVGIGRKSLSVRGLQEIVGVVQDGKCGSKTIKAINEYDEAKFSKQWDEFEMKFYGRLVKNNPKLKWALNGWHSRSRLV